MRDKNLQLEDQKGSHTRGGAVESKIWWSLYVVIQKLSHDFFMVNFSVTLCFEEDAHCFVSGPSCGGVCEASSKLRGPQGRLGGQICTPFHYGHHQSTGHPVGIPG